MTTRPAASRMSWLTVALKASPALACRVVIVSLAASDNLVPAAAVRVVGTAGATGLGAGGWAAGRGAFFSGAGLAGSATGAGTSVSAAVDSVGASVRLRAAGSAAWAACSPWAHANRVALASTATGNSRLRIMRYLSLWTSVVWLGLRLVPPLGTPG